MKPSIHYGRESEMVADLRAKARHHYIAYHREVDGLGCGAAMAQHLKPAAAIHAREFDSAMDALAEIDPKCPPMRLSSPETRW